MTRRKSRSDSNYIIYEICDENLNSYIGLTRKTETTLLRSLKRRWSKHLSRAKCGDVSWKLYEHIRNNENCVWKHKIIEIIRGRKEAYSREREIILEKKPNLNVQYVKGTKE